MPITLTLTSGQADALLVLAERGQRLTRSAPAHRRRVATRALDQLRDALDGHIPDPIEFELHALADSVDKIRDRALHATLITRLRALGAVAHDWITVERLHRCAAWAEDPVLRARCAALLDPERALDPAWSAEVAALLADCVPPASPPPSTD